MSACDVCATLKLQVGDVRSFCRSCRARIVWMLSDTVKHVPLDEGFRIVAVASGHGDDHVSFVHGHESHFATCPDASKWRRSAGAKQSALGAPP
jgi:hypothetical protein